MHTSKSSRDNSVIQSDIKRQFTKFLQVFMAPSQKFPKYLTLIKTMLQSGKHLLIISYTDLISFNNQLANYIFDQYYKHQPLLNQALTQLTQEYMKNQSGIVHDTKRDQQKQEKYMVAFDAAIHGSGQQVSVRELRCDKLGKLFGFRGTVTRTSQIRPELIIGVFKCKSCGLFSKPITQQFKYTEPKKCFTQNCDKPVWELDIQKSQIQDFQKLRVQQDPTKIPPGAMPRSIDVILRNESTEKGQPGDICRFIGYLCVLPEVASMVKPGQKTTISTRNYQTRGQMMEMDGVRGLKGVRELNYRLIFVATNVVVENNQFREQQEQDQEQQGDYNDKGQSKPTYNEDQVIGKIFAKLTQKQIQAIKQLKSNPNLYQDMATSLFPSIFGQSQIKKAILLQLFGGIHKITHNKITIRGDINILIVGDPSTAKSQFLKAVNKFVPRSVYTNGKTTSAAGLTATVTKDQSGTVGIQAGALMLADNGICCIDQFDKMRYTDLTAIHQAMQQQTISIAKAGVYATLNARTSILAAANPIFGRYDKSKSLKHNINISPPIMSRFDLFFVICDQTNDHADANLSQFIINMHRNKQRAIVTKYNAKSIKVYISTAKKLKPMLTKQAGQLLRKYYKQLRLRDKSVENTSYRVTVRQLESMIRISEALARLYLDTQIKGDYVREAYRLITTCIMKLQKSPIIVNEDQQYQARQRQQQGLMKGDLALQRQLQHKKKQKAQKTVTISYEQYSDIQKCVLMLFQANKQQQNQMRSSQNQQEQQQQEVQISHEALVNYIIADKARNGLIQNQEQMNQMKKLINAIIKKLIREQRMLMIVEDDTDLAKRILKLHPNFVTF